MDIYVENCKKAIVSTGNNAKYDRKDLFYSSLKLVWFCKSLMTQKALFMSLSATYKNHYWEVTYNGSRSEYYVDEYKKMSHKIVAVGELGNNGQTM